jgi:hypothetical protein
VIFRRAIERRNPPLAEATARELGGLTLVDALELTILIARKTPQRHSGGSNPFPLTPSR